MLRALGIAATGMQAQQTNVEVISNNIANVSTTGFKRSMAEFQDLLYQNADRVGTESSETGTILPTGTQIGLGVRNSGVNRITSQGTLTQTDNKLDVAVDGRGYFGILLPNGETAYTRDGSFKFSDTGQIVTNEGYQVLPGITIDPRAKDVTINQAGEVVMTDSSGKQQTIGRLQLYIFANEAGLEAQGGNNFLATTASGDPIQGLPNDPGFGTIRQGYLESSNVNVVQEITSLIQAQRSYELNSKVIDTANQMMQTTSQLR
jgi:flagellar basal-body rod protein FlgG